MVTSSPQGWAAARRPAVRPAHRETSPRNRVISARCHQGHRSGCQATMAPSEAAGVVSASVQVPADRPTDGFGDADVFLGGTEQQFAFEFRIKAYRFDR